MDLGIKICKEIMKSIDCQNRENEKSFRHIIYIPNYRD